MKKTLFALAATLAVGLHTAAAQDDAATVTKRNVIAGQLRGVSAYSTFGVTLRQNSDPKAAKVTVTIDSRLAPYLVNEIEDGILALGFKNLPRELQNTNNWRCAPSAEVTVTRLDYLETSGLANIMPEGSFSGNIKRMSASGNSKIGPLELTVPAGSAIKVNTSGLSKITLSLNGAQDVEAEASGNSNQTLDLGNLESLDASTSGLSHITATGSAQRVEAEASGNSGLSLVGVQASSVECSTSGLSKITCHPTRSLKAEASGNSRINYQGGASGLQTNLDKSGMSSISAID